MLFKNRNLVLEQLELGNDSLELIMERTQLTEKQVLRAARNLFAVKRLNGEIAKIGDRREIYVHPKRSFTKVQYIIGIISLVAGLISLCTLSWIYPSLAEYEFGFYSFWEIAYNYMFYITMAINGTL